MANFNVNDLNRKLRDAQRQAEREYRREVDRVNRANKNAVDDYNRRAESHNRRAVADYNREVERHNRGAETHNKKVIADLNKQLRSSPTGVRYTESERALADRVSQALDVHDDREYDAFLSYARIDGADTAGQLRAHLENLGASVWFDEVAIVPGRSQSRQMDAGLQKARSEFVKVDEASGC